MRGKQQQRQARVLALALTFCVLVPGGFALGMGGGAVSSAEMSNERTGAVLEWETEKSEEEETAAGTSANERVREEGHSPGREMHASVEKNPGEETDAAKEEAPGEAREAPAERGMDQETEKSGEEETAAGTSANGRVREAPVVSDMDQETDAAREEALDAAKEVPAERGMDQEAYAAREGAADEEENFPGNSDGEETAKQPGESGADEAAEETTEETTKGDVLEHAPQAVEMTYRGEDLCPELLQRYLPERDVLEVTVDGALQGVMKDVKADGGAYEVAARVAARRADDGESGEAYPEESAHTEDGSGAESAHTEDGSGAESAQTEVFRFQVQVLPKPVRLTWSAAPEVYTGETFEVLPSYDEDLCDGDEVCVTVKILSGQGQIRDAGDYQLKAEIADPNYVPAPDEDPQDLYSFAIRKRRVQVTGTPQKKVFGAQDPVLAWEVSDGETQKIPLLQADAAKDLEGQAVEGTGLILREAGELPGKYAYVLNLPEETDNYEVSLVPGYFEIEKLKLGFRKEDRHLHSRDGTIRFITDGPEEATGLVQQKMVISALFPKAQEITFSRDLSDYLPKSSEGIIFSGSEGTLRIRDAAYQSIQGDQVLRWSGKLPAGTRLQLVIYGMAHDGKSWQPVSNYETITVEKTQVGLQLTSSARERGTDLLTGADTLTVLPGDGISAREYVKIYYHGTSFVPAIGEMLSIRPLPDNDSSSARHNTQQMSAAFVDTLNLSFSPCAYTFVYDDQAFPVTKIDFTNRSDHIQISLPEPGVVTEVSIAGLDGSVQLSGEVGQDFSFPVQWSGQQLIAPDAAISVSYQDLAGNRGAGAGTALRAKVVTPITLHLTPSPNDRGYLGGNAHVLMVSGTACSCEPLVIEIAGRRITTYAAREEQWADRSGTWQIPVDLSDLPQGETIRISAAYLEVQGQGAVTETAYKAFAFAPLLLSPVFSGMRQISGLAEPGSTLYLQMEGWDAGVTADQEGHFVCPLPEFSSEEAHTLEVMAEDVAGNRRFMAVQIPAGTQTEQVSGKLSPVGCYFYEGHEEQSLGYTVTALSLNKLADGPIEVPLLFGDTYKAGTLTLTEDAQGILVETKLFPGFLEAAQGQSLRGKVYLYPQKPTLRQLREKSGQCYDLGTCLPGGADSEIYLVLEQEIRLAAKALEKGHIYDFGQAREGIQ